MTEPDNDLTGRTALVTGAARGLGRAICVALAAAGANVAVADHRRPEESERTCRLVEDAGRRAVALEGDLTREEEVRRVVQETEAALGAVEVLVNNIGASVMKPVEELTGEDLQFALDVNVRTAFLCTQAVLPGMRQRRWGRVINLASSAAQMGSPVGPHYSAAKGAIVGMTHGYALALQREGVTVNAVAPARMDTESNRELGFVQAENVPVGRLGRPEEVAAAVAMLAGNGFMTGQVVSVNGGVYFTH